MTEIVQHEAGTLARQDLETAFAAFLRLNVAAGDASPKTIRAYKSRVGQFYGWASDNGIRPGDATEDDVRAYRKHLIEEDYARETIAGYLQAVRRFFDAAVWRGLRADNPAAGVKPPRELTNRAERTKYLPLAGLQQLLGAPDTDTPKGTRDAAILALMGKHGLRVGEVAGLTIDSVTLGDSACLRVAGKGGKARTVYLTASSCKTLEAWLAERPAGVGHNHVFVTLDPRTSGRPISTRSIRRLVDGYLEDVGLKGEGISCHSLRHSAATWSLAAGASERSIQDLLGHSTREMTQAYAKIVDRIASNPTEKLEELLGA